ncbi:MAG: class I adenylate-forming enzyme family protein, partial [Actinomycetes bacterium]
WLRASPGAGTFSRGIRGPGGILTNFPLYHYGGWHYVLESWHARRPLHLIHRADGDEIADTVAERRPAALYFIPGVWDRVLDALPPELDLGFVGHADTGTSAAPPELLARIGARLPSATTSVLYGSSEAGHHTTLHPEDLATHPGSVGRAAPPTELEVDEHGEVLVRGPTVMDGYLDRPDLTATALAGGWYHTGDLGHFDGGYLYITGRTREVIRTGGESVAPTEVERCLRGRPELADVAVVGLPDPHWGQIVCAVVVPAAGAPIPDVDTLRSWLDGRLARHKHPRRVVAVDRIPRTPATGQIQRTLLETRLGGGGRAGATHG